MGENNSYDKITTEGATILVIGPDEARLCVHSCLLQSASKVFKAMLGPLYREGQRSGLTGSKKEIPLPEDDADAMTITCAVIHHRNDMACPSPNPSTTQIDNQDGECHNQALLKTLANSDCPHNN